MLSRPASPPQKEAVPGGRSTNPLVRRWPDAVGLAAAVRARAAGGLALTALCLTIGLAVATQAFPTAIATPRELPLTLVALTSPVRRGHDARLTVRTAPDTQCLLLVQYRVGGAPANVAIPKRADGKGLISWTWRVDPKATPGSWPIIVHCSDKFKGNMEERRLELSLAVR